jgi:hypothetical protein
MTDTPTLAFMMTTISGWFTVVFTGIDSIQIWGITLLDLFVTFAIVDITIWFAFRMIDSPKSDN